MDEHRFTMELEFVQCLANPEYVLFLAQRALFINESFIAYLKYLLYWKRPEYACYISYPAGLRMLERMQEPNFRMKLADPEFIGKIHRDQYEKWIQNGNI